LKRDVSELHAATLPAVSASAAARSQLRARNISRTQDMATHSYAIQAPS
jgi:hypothetical protein